MLQTPDDSYPHKELTARIIGAFYAVYDALGYGFLESVYIRALAIELARRGLQVKREAVVKVWYAGIVVGTYRADQIVEEAVVVEVKASKRLCEADGAQLLNYLRCSRLEVGLLLHFGPRAAIKRFVASKPRYEPSASSAPRA